MDDTLKQILSALYAMSAELDRARPENEALRERVVTLELAARSEAPDGATTEPD